MFQIWIGAGLITMGVVIVLVVVISQGRGTRGGRAHDLAEGVGRRPPLRRQWPTTPALAPRNSHPFALLDREPRAPAVRRNGRTLPVELHDPAADSNEDTRLIDPDRRYRDGT